MFKVNGDTRLLEGQYISASLLTLQSFLKRR